MHAFKMQGDIVCILLNMLKHNIHLYAEKILSKEILDMELFSKFLTNTSMHLIFKLK